MATAGAGLSRNSGRRLRRLGAKFFGSRRVNFRRVINGGVGTIFLLSETPERVPQGRGQSIGGFGNMGQEGPVNPQAGMAALRRPRGASPIQNSV